MVEQHFANFEDIKIQIRKLTILLWYQQSSPWWIPKMEFWILNHIFDAALSRKLRVKNDTGNVGWKEEKNLEKQCSA